MLNGSLLLPTLNPLVGESYQQTGYGLNFVYDQLDNPRFPRKGNWARLHYFRPNQAWVVTKTINV